MRERSPGSWELIVEAGRDPVTGRSRQVSRTFHGNLRDAKKARAELLVEVGKGRHTGTAATVEELYRRVDRRAPPQGPLAEHRLRLRACVRAQRPPDPRQGRRDQGEHEDAHRPLRRPSGPGPVGPQRVPGPRLSLVDVHPGVPVGLARHEPGAVGRATVDPERRTGRADTRRRPPADRGGRAIEAAGVRPCDPRRRHDRAAAGRTVCVAPTTRCGLGSASAQGVGLDRRPQGRAAAGDPDQEPSRADASPSTS